MERQFYYSKELQVAEDELNNPSPGDVIESHYEYIMAHAVVSMAKSLELLAEDVAVIKRKLG